MRQSLFLLMLLLVSCATAQEKEQYCNTNYHFCLDYPASALQLSETSADKAFANFMSEDQSVRLEVTSKENPEDWSLEDIYYMTFEDKLRRNPDLEIVNEIFNKSDFELLYHENDQLHYHHVYKHGKQYVQLSMYLPKAQKQRFEQLKSQLTLTFNE